MCKWKEWKNPRTKTKRLVSLGVPKEKAFEWGNSRKKYCRISMSPILTTTNLLTSTHLYKSEIVSSTNPSRDANHVPKILFGLGFSFVPKSFLVDGCP